MSRIAMSRDEARQFVAQCFRLRHVHPRWREWLRIALREARANGEADLPADPNTRSWLGIQPEFTEEETP